MSGQVSGSASSASEDPTQVIPGNPEELRAGARNYTALAERLEQTGRDMRGQGIANWRARQRPATTPSESRARRTISPPRTPPARAPRC
jgi:hypothetical protein